MTDINPLTGHLIVEVASSGASSTPGGSQGSSMPLPASVPVAALGPGPASVQVLPATAGRRLADYSFRENAGSTASLVLHNGTSATNPITYITLAPNETTEMEYSRGLDISAGLYLELQSGSIIGAVAHALG